MILGFPFEGVVQSGVEVGTNGDVLSFSAIS